MKKAENIFWGLLLIVIGGIIGLNSLGITNINIFFNGWWTLFIIIPSLKGVITKGERTWSFIWLIAGIALLLGAQGLISFNIIAKLAFPAILIILGLSIIFKDTISKNINEKINELNKDNLEDYTATFSGQEINLAGQEFKGANINAIFGGVDLNLKDAKIEKDEIINLTAVFGGVDILVPANVNVKVKSTSIFGGVDNKIKTTNEQYPTIYIKAFCLFGGADIK